MKLKKINQGDVVVIDLAGKLTTGEAPRLLDAITDEIEAEHRLIVVDMKGISYMDSAGIGTLVEALNRTVNQGGRLVLARPDKKVRDLLSITHLDTVFDMFESRDSAVEELESKDLPKL